MSLTKGNKLIKLILKTNHHLYKNVCAIGMTNINKRIHDDSKNKILTLDSKKFNRVSQFCYLILI
jgi:hypothetical protein